MSPAALLRLARRALLGTGRHRRRRVKREALNRTVNDDDEEWIRDLLPPTPRIPAPAEPAEAWAPRITRWIRLTSPLPDDTILLSPIPAATVLEFMGRGFLWDPSR